MTLATLLDLATLTGLPETEPRLALALRRASGAFVDAVGWPVVLTTDEVILLRGDGSQELILPARPVISASVVIDEVTEVATDDPAGPLVLDGRLGVLTRRAGWPGLVRLKWTYGYRDIPEGIVDVVLERAAHIAEDLGLYASISTGSLSETYAAGVTGGATERWVQTVARYQVGVGDRS